MLVTMIAHGMSLTQTVAETTTLTLSPQPPLAPRAAAESVLTEAQRRATELVTLANGTTTTLTLVVTTMTLTSAPTLCAALAEARLLLP